MATGKGPAKQAGKALASKKTPPAPAQKKVAASNLTPTPKKTVKPKK
jgi:hypothetical protein